MERLVHQADLDLKAAEPDQMRPHRLAATPTDGPTHTRIDKRKEWSMRTDYRPDWTPAPGLVT
jgi:hypothetical protein